MSLAQKPSSPPLSQKDRAKILSVLRKLVPERHINVSNPNQDYAPWIALVDERIPRLIAVDDTEAFEAAVTELLTALGSSHTAFFHQPRDLLPPPSSITPTSPPLDTPSATP